MDGTAAVSYGDVTAYAIRLRCASGADAGFIFEDGANRGLLSLSGLNGNAQLRGTLSVGGALSAPSLTTTGNVTIGGKCTVTGDLMSTGQAVPTTHPISFQFSVTSATGKYTISSTFVAKGTSTCIQYNCSGGITGGSGSDAVLIRPAARVGTSGSTYATVLTNYDMGVSRYSTSVPPCFTTMATLTTVAGQRYTFGIDVGTYSNVSFDDTLSVYISHAVVYHTP